MPGKTVIRRGLTEDQRDRVVKVLGELKLFKREICPRSSPRAIQVRDGIDQVMIGFGLFEPIEPDSSKEG